MAKTKTNSKSTAPKLPEKSVPLNISQDSSRSLGDDDSFSVVGSESALPSFDMMLDRDEIGTSTNLLEENEVKKANSGGPLNEGNTVPLKNFSNLFKGNCLDECKLEEFPIADGPVAFEDEDLVSIEDEWCHTLIGGFSDKFPGLKAIKARVDSWKVHCKIIPHNEAWVLLKFENEQDLERVLFGGPYTVYNRAFFLQKLPKYFNFCNINWTVPVWVRLPGLPLDCWHPRALSKIASKIGKPISTDRLTYQKKCISFARILVEVDASTELPSMIPLQFPGGQIIDQRVVFEHTPKYCKSCIRFGHLQSQCAATGKNSGAAKVVSESNIAVPTTSVSPSVAPPKGNKGLSTSQSDRTNLDGSRGDSMPDVSAPVVNVVRPTNAKKVNDVSANVSSLPDPTKHGFDNCLYPPESSEPPAEDIIVGNMIVSSANEDDDNPFIEVRSNKKKKASKNAELGGEKAVKPNHSLVLGPKGWKPQNRGDGGRRPIH